MNERNIRLAADGGLVPGTYLRQGHGSLQSRAQLVTTLLSQRRVPDDGWDELTVELVLHELAAMDSNNFPANVGAGEREARVFSPLVARRHFYLSHGVGRSGDVAAAQPKAAGSSLLVALANALARDMLRDAGLRATAAAVVLPVATGMSLTLVLLSLLGHHDRRRRYVIWPRIDQKSGLKAICAAGLTPLVVPMALDAHGQQLGTDIATVDALLAAHGDEVLAVLTTTSCFAPRAPDRVVAVAELCRDRGVAHVINNAYGVQSPKCMHAIHEATHRGRVDAVVQSLDKNFLMPVGGAIVSANDPAAVERVAKIYPGRASNAPTVDFVITMLQMGRREYRRLRTERTRLFAYLREQLSAVAEEIGERVIDSPQNEISIAMSLGTFAPTIADPAARARELTFFGSMLFARGVSGARVVSCLDTKSIAGLTFRSYGAHHDAYPTPYITFACAIGMTRDEIDELVLKLRKVVREWRKRAAAASRPSAQSNE